MPRTAGREFDRAIIDPGCQVEGPRDAPDALNCAGMPVSFENIEIPLSDADRAIQSGDTVLTRR